MTEFVAFAPDVEVSGAVIQSLIDGTQGRIVPVLEEHGLAGITPDGWYPKQKMLDAMKSFGFLADLVGMSELNLDDAIIPFFPEHHRLIHLLNGKLRA